MNRRRFIRSLSRTALVLPFADILSLAAPAQEQAPTKLGPRERSYEAKPAPPPPGPKSPIEGTPLGVTFTDVAALSGLTLETTYGGKLTNKYLLETTGCGLAFYDYDDDGWQDLFLVNGWRLEGFPAGSGTPLPPLQKQPRRHLHRRHQGLRPRAQDRLGAGLLRRRLQQRRQRRSLRHLLRPERPLPQQRQRHLHRRHPAIRPHRSPARRSAGTPAAPSSTTTATATWISSSPTTSTSTSRPPRSPKMAPARTRACSSPAAHPAFPAAATSSTTTMATEPSEDVSEKVRHVDRRRHLRPLSVAASDLDNDGWPDIYVANDSAPATLYQNQKDGTFQATSPLKPAQPSPPRPNPRPAWASPSATTTATATFDVVKTNFAGDTDSLYTNTRRSHLRRPHLPRRPRRKHPSPRLGRRLLST